jgi:hypothetical protein
MPHKQFLLYTLWIKILKAKMRNVGRAWFETLSRMKLRGACNPANSSNEDYMYHFRYAIFYFVRNKWGAN